MTQDLAQTSLATFLENLASASPTPGGGAAAALCGAVGAALVSMVCNLTIGRPRYAAVEAELRETLRRADEARHRLLALAEEDARAYGEVAAAYKLPRGTSDERADRDVAVQGALKRAVEPPLEVMAVCRGVLPLSLVAAARGNPNVASDAGCAAEIAAAGVRAAVLNVGINLSELRDLAFVAAREEMIASSVDKLEDDVDRVIALVRARIAAKARP